MRIAKIAGWAAGSIIAVGAIGGLSAYALLECGEYDPCPNGRRAMPYAALAALVALAIAAVFAGFLLRAWRR